jgi:hypothetical protein
MGHGAWGMEHRAVGRVRIAKLWPCNLDEFAEIER